jgi:DNA-binding Lrp family transcriptional regulator
MLGADFDVLVLVRAPDNAALRDLVLDRIQAIPGVQTTRTWLVFDELLGPGADWS